MSFIHTRFITTLDRYIIRKFLTTFFFTLGLFLAISIIFDVAEKIDDFIQNHLSIKTITIDYYLNFIPYFGILFSPMVVFISVIFFTSKMAYDSEIISILCSGISFHRLLRPYFIAALFLASLAYFANHWLVPSSNKKRLAFENTYINNPYVNTTRNIHLQIDDENYIYMENYNNLDNMGYKFALEKIINDQLVFKLRGDRIQWINTTKKWRIFHYTSRTNDGMNENIFSGEQLDTFLNFSPKDFEEKVRNVEMMNSTELNQFIMDELARGADNIEFYLVEKYRRTAMPFATFILTLIGVSVASRKVRGGKGLHIAIGIFISFAYIVFMQFSTTLSTNTGFSPFIGVWIPNFLFSILGVYLLRKANK